MPSSSNSIVLLLFILMAFTSSCESDFNIKADFVKKLVLNSEITPGQKIKVLLTENRPTNNANTISVIKDATMLLTVNDTLKLPFVYIPKADSTYNNLGYYYADYLPHPLDKIEITATHPDYTAISATEFVPMSIAMQDISLLSHPTPANKSLPAKVHISFYDPPGKDYYMIDIWYINYEKNYDSTQNNFYYNENYIFSREENIQGITLTNTAWGNAMFDDLTIDNSLANLDVTITNPVKSKSGNKLSMFIDFRRISASYYLYQKTFAQNQDDIYDAFKEPSFVYNNIQGGYGILMSWVNDFRRINIIE